MVVSQGSSLIRPLHLLLAFPTYAARIHIEKALGVAIGDVHVIRNAGGRAVDALRSVTISQQLLGTTEVGGRLAGMVVGCLRDADVVLGGAAGRGVPQ